MIKAVTTLMFLLAASFAGAASFDVIAERKVGDWSAVQYRNSASGRIFCAMESTSDATVFRIVSYKDSAADTFLEVFNPNWNLIEGSAKFSVALQIDKQAFTAELMGNRVKDAYIHDFTDNDSYAAFLGMISKSSSVSVMNSNGANVVTLGGQGTSEALSNFGDCLHNDWETTRQSNQLPFRFDQYTVPHRAHVTKVSPSFAGKNSDFRAFQTRLRNGMREGPNFADHYTVMTIGCGTNCVFVVVGNNATGDLLKFPLDGDDNYLALQFQVGSSLLVAQGTETGICRRNYYNFVNGQFELLAKLTSDDSDACQKPIPQH